MENLNSMPEDICVYLSTKPLREQVRINMWISKPHGALRGVTDGITLRDLPRVPLKGNTSGVPSGHS